MKIIYSKDSLKFLKKASKSLRDLMLEKIKGLTFSPPLGDFRPLHGSITEYRLRVGKYRVIYEYDFYGDIKILLINDIGSRGDIYK